MLLLDALISVDPNEVFSSPQVVMTSRRPIWDHEDQQWLAPYVEHVSEGYRAVAVSDVDRVALASDDLMIYKDDFFAYASELAGDDYDLLDTVTKTLKARERSATIDDLEIRQVRWNDLTWSTIDLWEASDSYTAWLAGYASLKDVPADVALGSYARTQSQLNKAREDIYGDGDGDGGDVGSESWTQYLPTVVASAIAGALAYFGAKLLKGK